MARSWSSSCRGRRLAVAGPAEAAQAVARGLLLRLAADHGPADLAMAVMTADRRSGGPGCAGYRTRAASISRRPARRPPLPARCRHDRAGAPVEQHRTLLLVIDDPAALATRTGPARRLLAAGAMAIVVAEPGEILPHVCREVLALECPAVRPVLPPVAILRGADAEPSDAIEAAGVSAPTALELARRLAGYHDPEEAEEAAALPAHVRLVELLGPPPSIPRRWPQAGPAGLLPATRAARWRRRSAMAEDGIVEIDLVADGPHALVAGTTGSGKSELLRSLVAGLAATHPPSDVAFLLVDYKGGSAFDACARLPHVVGVVTDLDGHLAERALRSLHAELRRREALLRDAGCDDIDAGRAAGVAMPRLVVVIDEFATLAAELPDFLHAIVGVARRGRSLGVHLVLATQRPGSAVSDEMRANTNLRVALRVQDVAESNDVVGVGSAARIARGQPGRGGAAPGQ